MTTEQLRTEMLNAIEKDSFGDETPINGQNVNWMFVVYNVECVACAQDLVDMLALLNAHYDGPISIEEDGGCHARSNQELIETVISFNLYENFCGEYAKLAMYAIELNWLDMSMLNEAIDYSDYSFRFVKALKKYTVNIDHFPLDEAHIDIDINVKAPGEIEYKRVISECVSMSELEWLRLRIKLENIECPKIRLDYLKVVIKQSGESK